MASAVPSTSSQREVPLIDLAASEAAVIEQIAGACRDWGFFQVVNHGVDAALCDQALAVTRQFFDLDAEAKRACSRSLDQPWGYYDRELTKNERDRKEIFDFGQEGVIPWPASPADFQPDMLRYSAACYELALRLLDLAGRGLGLAPDTLAPHFAPQHSSFMRLNYYPQDDDLLRDEGMPAPGQLGINPHTDAGGLTVLLQDAVSGLQMQQQGEWLDVRAHPGALTINIGDMLQVWANDTYHAALHRVRGSTAERRFSIAYFLNPAYRSVVRPLAAGEARYREISWEEFRGLRAQGDYGDYGEEVQISHYRC